MQTKTKISELQSIMTKMPLEVCCMSALPEFGVRWRDVSKAVRNARLPMTSASVARVVCRHLARSLDPEDADDLIARLQLKLVASQSRTWHVILLEGKVGGEGAGEEVTALTRSLPGRIRQAVKTGRAKDSSVEVHTVAFGSLVYVRVCQSGRALFAALAAGAPGMALVSGRLAAPLLRLLAAGLGYSEYRDGRLHGSDPQSLLRVRRLPPRAAAPYRPRPAPARDGIDYTARRYDEEYLDDLLGPDPPLLTHLHITTTRAFFDKSRLNKQMNLVVELRSEDVARSLRAWAAKGALAPTSDFFSVYHQIKANKFTYTREDSD